MRPGVDIEIKLTGLQSGEKLHEELVEDPAGVDCCDDPDILRLRGENPDIEDLAARLSELEQACRGQDASLLLRRLQLLVPTFQPSRCGGPPASRPLCSGPADTAATEVLAEVGLEEPDEADG